MKIIVKPKHSNITKGGEKRMRYSKMILALGVAGFILATLITSWAAENIRNTKHNLSSTIVTGGVAGDTDNVTSNTEEVCVFCHTPHGSRTPGDEAQKAFPLWNRKISTDLQQAPTYTMYASPNLDATVPSTPLGVSMACLSCHDGTIAFDALYNYPGSGNTDNIDVSGNNVDSNTGRMINTNSWEFPMLGTTLSNDHPISIEIPCGTDPQFKELCDNSPAAGTGVTLLKRDASYDTNITQLTDKRNNIRAYPTGGTTTRYIECASCHNPHEATSSRFLRYPSIGAGITAKVSLPSNITASDLDSNRNAGSLLCLSCHQK